MKRKLLYAFIIALICLSVVPFLRSATYGLINLDDYPYLSNNILLVNWQGIESIKHCFSDVSQSIWMPLTWLSYAFDFAVAGENYGWFHIHSILLHLTNAILLFFLLKQILRQLDGFKENEGALILASAAASIFWSIHPLRCESVVFLASRKDVLSFTFELVAFILWFRGGTVNTALSITAFVLGATAKPSVMTFPVLCLLVDVFIKREVKIWRYAVPLALAFGLAIFAGWQQKAGGATADLLNEPLWGRLLNACAAFGIYLRNTVWPQWLAVQCVNRWPHPPRFLIQGLALSTACIWFLTRSILQHWRNRKTEIDLSFVREIPVKATFSFQQEPLFVGLAWFAISIFPMLGLANFGYHAYADRFTYIPHVGLCIILAVLLSRGCQKLGYALTAIICALPLLALGGVSWWQTGFWENDQKAFSRTLEIDGEQNAFAHSSLALSAFEFHHDLDTFIREFETTLSLSPFTAMQNYELYILALCEQGKIDEAHDKIKSYDQLVENIFGPELAYALMAENPEGDDALGGTKLAQLLRSTRKKLKFVFWLHAPEFRDMADECLARENVAKLEKTPFYAYLLWKRAAMNNDVEEASRLKSMLTSGELRRCYIQFRFMRER